MGPVAIAIEQMVLSKIANSGMIGVPSNKFRLSPWTLAALLAFIGGCFLIAGAFLWLLNNYSTDVATAGTGILIIFFGLIIALGAYCFHEFKKSRINHYKNEFTDMIGSVLSSITDELEEPIKENPKMAVLLSILAGFILSKNIL